MIINPIDRERLRQQVESAAPFPHFKIDNFLDEEFAREVARELPSLDEASKLGKGFTTVNEKLKYQITDSTKFTPALAKLNETFATPEWVGLLSEVMGIPKLLADEHLEGGGVHVTGSRGRLDVHVDFNYIEDRQLHRRLNTLVYLNEDWQEDWGGNIELWDERVKVCAHPFSPVFNRCVTFETNSISYHGVTAVNCPPERCRKSFATYYYTKEPSPDWTGERHSTIFKARPDEKVKGALLMPLGKISRTLKRGVGKTKRAIKGGRD